MRTHFFLFALMLSTLLPAQTRMRDLFAQAPDSIFPLLTKNNKLDMIDFCENSMPGVIKNSFDNRCELLQLTDSYLKLQLSERCLVEMRLLTDSTFCMVRTYYGSAPDSHVALLDTAWHALPQQVQAPAVREFLSAEVSEDVRLALEALPFVSATLSADDNSITWHLSCKELSKEQKSTGLPSDFTKDNNTEFVIKRSL